MSRIVSAEDFAEQRAARRRARQGMVGNSKKTKEVRKFERPGMGRGTAHLNAGHKTAETRQRSKD